MPIALVMQALIAILMIVIGMPDATAQPLRAVPALSARVIDETGTLSAAQQQALETQLAAIEQRHGSQVVVLMVPSTAPEDIAAFANRVGNTWKIGRKEVGDGVLVLVAKDDRRMRIEVAKALEGAIPDIAAARIIDDAMKPRFREGDFAGGLTAAVQQIGARIAGENLPLPETTPPVRGTPQGDLGWSDLAIFLFFGVMVAGPVLRRVLGQRLGGVVMGGGAGILAFVVTSSLLLAAGAALAALLYTWLFAGRSVPLVGHGGGWTGGGRGGWGGGSAGGLGGGGFGSGGGGDFGGGGASGDW
ncbi:MAG: YgcG family protein [Proteobacteria bacterium]|nr:YgcG family protein [Pseudomonadota bacterium]